MSGGALPIAHEGDLEKGRGGSGASEEKIVAGSGEPAWDADGVQEIDGVLMVGFKGDDDLNS